MPEHKILYDRREAASLLSLSLRTLDALIAKKDVPVRRIGRRVLISSAALAAFAAQSGTSQSNEEVA